jgi:KaiC/GvpD/RAD55 family RecA-like ATPase
MTFSRSDSVEKFFNTIWRDTEGYVYLPTAGKDGDWKKVFFQWPKHRAEILSHVERNAAERREVYYSPVLYSEPRPKKDYIKGSHVLWADFDGNAPDSWDRSSEGISAPSLTVQSSDPTHQHTYWVLDDFITSVPALEAMNRSLAYKLKADPSCWDATQLLRPPGTTNFGYAKKRDKSYDVSIADLHDTVHSGQSFQPSEDIRDQIKVSLSEADIPPIDKVLTLHQWDERFYELFNRNLRGTKGKRSDSLMALAYMGAENNLTDGEIYSIISDADTRWEVYTSRTNRHFLLSDIITRARNKHPFSNPDEFAFLTGLSSAPTEIAPKNDYGFGEILSASISIKWLFTGLFSTGGYGIIYGTPGVGKTQLGIRIAMALCLGRDFLLWKNEEHEEKRVTFFSLEMDLVELKVFYEKMAENLDDTDRATLTENFRTVPIGEAVPLDKPEGRKYFEQTIKETKADVVLLDSYTDASYASLSNDDTVRELVRYLRGIRKRYNIAIYIIHHDKKAQAADPKALTDGFDRMYGSRMLSAKADFVVGMLKTKDGNIVIREDKRRLGLEEEPIVIKRNEYLDFDIIGQVGDENGFKGILSAEDSEGPDWFAD